MRSRIVLGGTLAAALAAGLAVAGCTVIPGDNPLTANEIEDLLSGNTMVGVTQLERFKGKVFHVHLRPDGTLALRNFNGKTDLGVWEVTADGRYCNQYRHTRMGLRKCYDVWVRDGVWELVDTSDGFVTTRFTVEPGNPLGL
jgi:hypothetical protein